MKSIMEEASTISKAIEKGLAKAGNPKEFSVKIYEEPERNFFGITTKPAKIGIFFDEGKEKKYGSESGSYQSKPSYAKPSTSGTKHPQKQTPQPVKPKQAQEQQQKPVHGKTSPDNQNLKQKPQIKEVKPEQNKQQSTVHAKISHPNIQSHEQRQPKSDILEPSKPLWTPEMINAASDWLKQMLGHTEYANVLFDISADKYYLKINFASPICQDVTKERQLFAAIALLLMQGIKKKFENPFKGYKVILMRNESNS